MIRNKNTLLLDCAIKYLPDEVVRFHIFEKFLKDDEKKQYVTLKLKDMLIPNWIAILKEKSVFRKRLYAMKNCNRYVLIYLMSVLLGAVSAILYMGRRVIASRNIKDDQDFFKEFLKSKSMGVQVGDCVLSWVLRLDGSKGYLVRDAHFYKVWLRFMFNYYSQAVFAKCLATLYTGNKYFYSHETTYLDEAIRRILLRFGFREIRYDFFQHEAIVMPVLHGHEIRKRAYGRLNLDEGQFDLEKAENKLRGLVYRDETYSYMQSADVDVKAKLDISDLSGWGDQKVAVIYMHAVSDAQYFYGVDCFADLHGWLIESLGLLERLGINVCIKMHPSYFSAMHNYPVDKEYLKTLEKIFGISISQITSSKPMITNRPKVCFLHHSVSLLELCRVFPGFLCLTHHGTVATEAAYLGHAVICSSASPYIKNRDCFVWIYDSLEEYEGFIRKWIAEGGTHSQAQFTSLLVYMYINHYLIKPENIALVLANAIGFNMSLLDNKSFNQEMGKALTYLAEEDELFHKIEFAVQEYI